MGTVYMQAIKEWSDEKDIQVIMEFNFQTCQWLFKFYKKCTDGIREWKFAVPESYLSGQFEQFRYFSVLNMLAEAEGKFKEKVNDKK